MRTLRQTFVLTPARKVAIDRSVLQPTTNYPYVMKSTNLVLICVLDDLWTSQPSSVYTNVWKRT